MAERPTVYVCTGDDCRGEGARHRALLAAAGEAGRVRTVRCQKVCKGPVAGLEVDGRVEWFARVRRRARGALVDWLRHGGPLPEELAERRVPKRSGRVR